jgi:hypothetical protein
MPHNQMPDPFVNSHFGMSLGVAASSKFENVILEIDGEPLLGVDGTLLFADLDFEYEQKIKDWIAVYFKGGLTARIGTELNSLLAQGINTVTSFRLGWLFKLAEGHKYLLSGNVQVNNHGASFINIGDFLVDVVEDTIGASISQKVPSLNATAGLRFAYGFNDLIGVRLNTEVGFGESFERGSTSTFYNLGGLVDLNLAGRTNVPLGFAFNLNLSTLPDFVYVDDRTALITGLKIGYTGAEHFVIGVETLFMKVPIPNLKEKISSTGVVITTKYYFN